MYDNGWRNTGSMSMGKKRPQRKITGKRKKLEKVWASKISLTETAMNKPRNVDTIAIIATAATTAFQAIPEISTRNMGGEKFPTLINLLSDHDSRLRTRSAFLLERCVRRLRH
jgi:hypothetical protein